MRFILSITPLLVCSEASIDLSSLACKSVCGLDHRATTRICEAVEADGPVCRHVYREPSGDILFSATDRTDYEEVTVESAVRETQAIENNCFAMCYDNHLCRPRGSFCTESGVCSALFWNKQKRQQDSYAFHMESDNDVSNQDAPVLCASATPEQLPGRDNGDRVDPCIAVCHLTIQTPDTCRWVEEVSGQCSRLFWTNQEKIRVEFSPRAPRSPQVEIQSQELVELLKAPGNNCQALCDSVSSCRSSGTGSFCRPNGTCQGLFYQVVPRLVKSEFVACYGEGCNELTPVMCDTEEPSVRPTDPLVVSQKSQVHILPKSSTKPISATTTVVPETTTSTAGKYADHGLFKPTMSVILLILMSL